MQSDTKVCYLIAYVPLRVHVYEHCYIKILAHYLDQSLFTLAKDAQFSGTMDSPPLLVHRPLSEVDYVTVSFVTD